jgi:CRISPR/Cas system endoribonuclease Cas6 (RAMP superfamily)
MRPMLPRITKNGLHILHEIFRLADDSSRLSRLSDVILIAIDFENINNIKSGFSQTNNCEVGLANFDTKEINQLSPDSLISTFNFATGSPSYLAKVPKNLF